MSKTVISVEHLSKRYQLGVIGATSLQRDLNRWWARVLWIVIGAGVIAEGVWRIVQHKRSSDTGTSA